MTEQTVPFNLVRYLFPIDPVLWACPIQDGIPYLLSLATQLLSLAAVAVFVFGVVSAVFYYFTAFGDEDRAKKGRETLKWTVLGAVLIMLANLIIMTAVSAVALPDQNLTIDKIERECHLGT